MLSIYNTQSRTKEEFKPLTPGHVKMYSCGPTVYDLLHVGNFRGAIFYNLVRNWLEKSGYRVNFVYNYTDVDDKIINRALRDKVPAEAIAEKYIEEFKKDISTLKLTPHSLNPRVSETMPEIIQMIQDLIAKGHAYASPVGDVWYSVRSFDGYGKLSNRNLDDLMAGTRVEPEDHKKDPMDFALWKHAKPEEPSWASPWGQGRPGWHIECSAMAKKHLGEQIDIHGGGLDLMFPHHENEIAQTEGSSGKSFVKYWMHNNMINFGGAKMSKSIGNVRTARSFMEQYNPEILKFMMLSSHYRSITDLSESAIELSIKGLARIYSCLASAELGLGSATAGELPAADEIKVALDKADQQVAAALNDDFNTPEVMAAIFEIVRLYNAKLRSLIRPGATLNPAVAARVQAVQKWIQSVGSLMALFNEPAGQFLTRVDDMLLKQMKLERPEVDVLVQERWQHKLGKDFKKADELRDQLLKMGIGVMDSATGSMWEVIK
jgi:cysteinyl-tRNA synthetase